MASKTQYLNVRGKIAWAHKLYVADEFRGGSNWTCSFYPADAAEWKKIKDAGIQLRPKKDDGSRSTVEYLGLKRPTQRTFGNKITYFTPPFINGKDGKPIVRYTLNGKPVYQYDDPKTVVNVDGEQIQIGNGSEVEVRLSYCPTQMGIGNRLESVKILDLIEYVAPEELTEEEMASATSADEETPWD